MNHGYSVVRAGVSSTLLVLLGLGCEETPPAGNTTQPAQLEIFSWWTSEGEAEALDELVGAHRVTNPNVSFVNIAVVNVNIDPYRELMKRMGLNEAGNPDASITPDYPDIMQWDLYNIEPQWLTKGIKFAPLDSIYKAEGWKDKFYPFVTKDIEFEGHQLALPVGLHRENSMFFNRQMLRDHNISEASLTGYDGLAAACEVLKAARKTCVTLTQEGWISQILFRNIAAMTMGPLAFHSYFGGKGNKNEPLVETSLRNYKSFIDKGYVGGWDNDKKVFVEEWGWNRVRAVGWADAAKDVHSGKAAFFFHGDWAVGLFKSLGWTAVDLGVRAAPGSQALFVYGADGFLVPEGGKNNAAVMEVIRTWGSPKVLAAFNKMKGSTPPRPDVDLSDDALANGVYTDLKQAQYIMPVPNWGDIAQEMVDLSAGTKTVEDVVQALRDKYPN